jgi:hypothetical protein
MKIQHAPLFSKSDVRRRSVIKVKLVKVETMVEQTDIDEKRPKTITWRLPVIQKDWPYVNPSLNLCSTPKVVTAMIFMTSVEDEHAT